MPKLQMGYPQEPVLKDGKYSATFKEGVEYVREYSTGPTTKVAWLFEVSATEKDFDPDVKVETEYDPNGPFVVGAHTSLATGNGSKFLEFNFPAFVGKGWSGLTEDLEGTECKVRVISYEDKNGQLKNSINWVSEPTKKAPVKVAAATDEVQVDESDFEDIPF